MIINGKPYKAEGDDAKARNIQKRRTKYYVSGNPTNEQKRLISKIENGLTTGKWTGDPYNLMRNAEYVGIELWEEELRKDGKWHRMDDPDVQISLMQTGAIL